MPLTKKIDSFEKRFDAQPSDFSDISRWRVDKKCSRGDGFILEFDAFSEQKVATEPFEFQDDGVLYFLFRADVTDKLSGTVKPNYLDFRLVNSRTNKIIQSHAQKINTNVYGAVFSLGTKGDNFHLEISNVHLLSDAQFSNVVVTAIFAAFPKSKEKKNASEHYEVPDEWSYSRKFLHRLCRTSPFVNALTARVEMRLMVEDVTSVPNSLAFCPTGQCNALCDFCSVTVNRTGIVKSQMAFEKITNLILSIGTSIKNIGLEGNGEPTLYKQFMQLAGLSKHLADNVYLITNGSRLDPNVISAVSQLQDVNFSLNAATAETHQKVMKLKNFDDVIAGIRLLVKSKNSNGYPSVSTSFVVTRMNIHEATTFIEMCEQDLKVDVIYLRPLSELANDKGVVEDMREIVPYRAQVDDMIEEVEAYLQRTPRLSRVVFEAKQFLSVKENPIGGVIPDWGEDGQLYVPRKGGWRHKEGIIFDFEKNRLRVEGKNENHGAIWFESIGIPVPSEKEFQFSFSTFGRGCFMVAIVDNFGLNLVSRKIELSAEENFEIFKFETGGAKEVYLNFKALDKIEKAFGVFCFDKVRKPASLKHVISLPNSKKWEVVGKNCFIQQGTPKDFTFDYDGIGNVPLVASFAMQCEIGHELYVPVSLELQEGSLGIAIGDYTTREWKYHYKFGVGVSEFYLPVKFLDSEQSYCILFSLDEGRISGQLSWQDTDPSNEVKILNIARPPAWQVNDYVASWVTGNDDTVEFNASGARGAVLAISPVVPMMDGQSICLSGLVSLASGALRLNLIDDKSQTILNSVDMQGLGDDFRLFYTSKSNRDISVNIEQLSDDEISAKITWHSGICPSGKQAPFNLLSANKKHRIADKGFRSDGQDRANVIYEKSFEEFLTEARTQVNEQSASLNKLTGPKLSLWQRIVTPQKVICHKPWTDLANFTVDGRMDVCCIATGSSQPLYQYGNLFEDDFQSIWNGNAAKAFRRTVNSKNPLPPCQRCPLQYQFSGLFFHWPSTRYYFKRKIFRVFEILKLSLGKLYVFQVYRGVKKKLLRSKLKIAKQNKVGR